LSWLLAAEKTAVIRKNSIEPRIQFCRVYMDFDRHSMNLPGEDKDIEPERASFIRKKTGKMGIRMAARAEWPEVIHSKIVRVIVRELRTKPS